MNRLEVRGVKRGNVRSSLNGQKRIVVIRRTLELFQKSNIGETSEGRSEAQMGLSERIDTILN